MALNFLFVTYGTEGDTRPLAALGRALIEAGHRVRLLADATTLDFLRDLGIPVAALAGDIRGAIARDQGMRDINRSLAAIVQANSTAWLRQAIDAGRDCDAVIVSGLAAFIGLSAAEALSVPAIGAMLIPITPTADFRSPFVPRALPRPFNRGSHHLVNQLVWWTFRKATNEARRSAGLAPRRSLWQGHPMLYGISPALVPPPPDWPDNAWLCGQWLPPPSATGPPPASLLAFLGAGPPPVYVGFGSMAGFDQAGLVRALVGALGQRRVLFNAGWSGIDPSTLPSHFHVIGDLSHDWLFPQTAAVIHHGGSGTTHSACRAGVPSVIVPFAGDQAFWASRLRDAGIAREVLAGRSLTAAALDRALTYALTAEARSRARELGERLRGEQGCAVAVSHLERLVPRLAPGAQA